MNQHNYISIGKFAGTHGLKGELVLKHGLGKKTSLKGLETVFVAEKTGNYLPWFVESARIKNDDEVFIKIEGLNTKEEAGKLVQKGVWLVQKDFEKYAAKTSVIGLLGFTIVDGDKELSTIDEVIEQPHQLLCRIEMGGKDVFIPLHEETLIEVDRKNRKVYVELPDGLLDIYLA